ncbi:MAG: TatD family hydrolase [Luteolibacter sp.]
MLTDSHCHLASHRYSPDEIPGLVSRAQDAGITRLITLATSLDDVEANLAIAAHPAVHACIGIHPCDVHHAPCDATEKLAAFTRDARVCAIGETGLDYYHPAPEGWEETAFRERQKLLLRDHFELAANAGLNIVIHTRDQSGDASFQDALAIYQNYHQNVRAMFHCFIGSWENAKRVIDLGGILSFGGVSTFKNAQAVRDTIVQCPAGSFTIETDSPYLAPEPYRGKRNEPAYTYNTAERIAQVRGVSLPDLAVETERTVAGFFRLK